jgi:hypothetical protein
MPKNIKDILIDATKFPAAIEAKLPEGAPKISTMLSDAAGKLPAMPDLPIEVPALPEPPTLPEAPAGLRGLGRRFVTGAEVTPLPTVVPPVAITTNLKSPKSQLVFE